MSAFLIYSEESNGTLSIVWSKTNVPNALISATTSVTIPEYKFKSGGISKLMINAHNPKSFYQGVCSFLKTIVPYKMDIRMISQPARYSLLLVFLDKDNRVIKLSDQSLNITLFKTAAAVSINCCDFDSKILDPALFAIKATAAGGSSINF